jgi:hypothetical protein
VNHVVMIEVKNRWHRSIGAQEQIIVGAAGMRRDLIQQLSEEARLPPGTEDRAAEDWAARSREPDEAEPAVGSDTPSAIAAPVAMSR